MSSSSRFFSGEESSSSLHFEDFIPEFPQQSDPIDPVTKKGIQWEVSRRYELASLAGKSKELVPVRGKGYSHQEAFKRMFYWLTDGLKIDETGTGKTCSFVQLAEYYKNEVKTGGYIRKVIVLQKGEANINDFRYQIICRCTAGDYEFKTSKASIDEASRQKRSNNKVKFWYDTRTIGTFCSEAQRLYQDDKSIDQAFAGTLFLVDEVHNLRNAFRRKEIEKIIFPKKGIGAQSFKSYDILWRIFHVVKCRKVILSTATPAINDVKEWPRIMNLILPADKQMPLNWDYSMMTPAQLEPFFRGYLSFVRSLDTGAQMTFASNQLFFPRADHSELSSLNQRDFENGSKELVLNVRMPKGTLPNDKIKYLSAMAVYLNDSPRGPHGLNPALNPNELYKKETDLVVPSVFFRIKVPNRKIHHNLNFQPTSASFFRNTIKESELTPRQMVPESETLYIPSQILTWDCYLFPNTIQGRVYRERIANHGNRGPSNLENYEAPQNIEGEEEEGKLDQMYADIRSASTFVFPDGQYNGSRTLDESHSDKDRFQKRFKLTFSRQTSPVPVLVRNGEVQVQPGGTIVLDRADFGRNYLRSVRSLSNYSTKYVEIAKQVASMARGNVFIFCHAVAGGGTDMIGLMFEHIKPVLSDYSDEEIRKADLELRETGIRMGQPDLTLKKVLERYQTYKEFDEQVPVLVSTGEKLKGICDGGGTVMRIRDNFPKAKRYIVLSDKTPPKVFQNALELFNSKQNCHGEYLQIIIGGPKTRDGINLYSVLKGFLATIDWHPSGLKQARSRYDRAVAYSYLLDEEIERLTRDKVARGLPEEEAKKQSRLEAKIEVQTYLLCAVPETDVTSLDLCLCRKIETKDIQIRRFLRGRKKEAVDAMIQYDRNIRADDLDYSAECGYDLKEFRCSEARQSNVSGAMASGQGPQASEYEYLTYDLFWSAKEIDTCISKILEFLKNRSTVTYTELYRIPKDDRLTGESPYYRERIVNMALEKIVYERVKMFDRFGFPCHLGLTGSQVHIQRGTRGFESTDLNEDGTFGNELVATHYLSFESLVAKAGAPIQEGLLQEILSLTDPRGKQREEFAFKVANLSFETALRFFELSYKLHIKNGGLVRDDYTVVHKGMLDHYKAYKMCCYKPNPIQPTKNRTKGASTKTDKQNYLEHGFPYSYPASEVPSSEFSGSGSSMAAGQREVIYMHTFHATQRPHGQRQYNRVPDYINAFRQVRVITRDELLLGLPWRVPEPEYLLSYKYLADAIRVERLKNIRSRTVHGIVLYGVTAPEFKSMFYISDHRSQEFTSPTQETVPLNYGGVVRNDSKGKDSTTYKVIQLVDILWYVVRLHQMNYGGELLEPPPVRISVTNENRREIASSLDRDYSFKLLSGWENTYRNEDLAYIYGWLDSRVNKKVLALTHVRRVFHYLGILESEDM